jgi:Acetyltransferase (GNAT) domain
VANNARLARRREPLHNFKTIAAALGENCHVWVARHRGEAVASIITLVFGQHAVYWRGTATKPWLAHCENNLLQGLAIQDACEAGCRYYSMESQEGKLAHSLQADIWGDATSCD